MLEKATGQPYSDYTRQRILQPLGLTDSGWNAAEVDSSRLATLYDVLCAFNKPTADAVLAAV